MAITDVRVDDTHDLSWVVRWNEGTTEYWFWVDYDRKPRPILYHRNFRPMGQEIYQVNWRETPTNRERVETVMKRVEAGDLIAKALRSFKAKKLQAAHSLTLERGAAVRRALDKLASELPNGPVARKVKTLGQDLTHDQLFRLAKLIHEEGA